jgi:hypothetical protein
MRVEGCSESRTRMKELGLTAHRMRTASLLVLFLSECDQMITPLWRYREKSRRWSRTLIATGNAQSMKGETLQPAVLGGFTRNRQTHAPEFTPSRTARTSGSRFNKIPQNPIQNHPKPPSNECRQQVHSPTRRPNSDESQQRQ